jgi:hypothetical protein
VISGALLAVSLAVPAQAQQDTTIFELAGGQSKQTSDDFLPAPSRIQTDFGTLEFTGGGYPTRETAQRVWDQLDLQRATQAYYDFIPALSLHGILKAQVRDYGARNSSDVQIFANRMDSEPLWLTGNANSIYAMLTLDMKKDGPLVIEMPAGVMGPLDDAYFRFVVDFGATGPDKGKGGKYLLLPPGYDGDIPEGYFVAQSTSYRLWGLLRANPGEGEKAMSFYRQLKVYPLNNPAREGRYIDVSGMPLNSLAPEDGEAFRWIHEIIDYEPADLVNKEQLGRLAALGIEKGKPFNPDARMKHIFDQAAKVGVAMARTNAFDSRDPDVKVYPDRQWETVFIGGSSEFEKNGYRNLEARSLFHYGAIVITPAMAAPMPEGVGSKYLFGYKDADGNYLDGSKTYRLHIPPEVPVKDFWSVTVYDPATRSQLQTGQQFPMIGSQDLPGTNQDGSIDIYFGPEAPEGKEKFWLETVPGKGWFVVVRFYGPLKAYNDKKWKPDDIELVK